MALDEPTDEMEKLESNGISAHIDTRLHEMLKQFGDINIDYVTGPQGKGYSVRAGDPGECGGGCESC